LHAFPVLPEVLERLPQLLVLSFQFRCPGIVAGLLI